MSRQKPPLTISAIVLSGLLAFLASCATPPGMDAGGERSALQFAERFIRACTGEEATIPGEMVGFPFKVMAPCKGGDFASIDELSESTAWSAYIDYIPVGRIDGFIMSPGDYFEAFDPKGEYAVERAAFVNRLGRDATIACMRSGDDWGMAVFVKQASDGPRAVGIGMYPITADQGAEVASELD